MQNTFMSIVFGDPFMPSASSRSARTRAFFLPVAMTEMIGRDRELTLAEQLLRRDQVRLLTITGPGGIGKTRLSVELAGRIKPEVPDGVAFVPLADIHDASGIISAITHALDLPETIGSAGIDGLVLALESTAPLIVLDNFEHVIELAPLVADLLAVCPRLKVLVTSRSLLRISGEYALPVPPLSLPGCERDRSWEVIEQSPAVQLFINRVQAVSPEFTLAETNAEVVAGICHHLDGMPLAIELAAAQVAVLPLHALLGRIEGHLPLPVPGPRNAPVRLRSIDDAVAWSYDLLGDDEQSLFRRLGIFAGGFTLDAAESVIGPHVLGGIAALVEKNLLQQSQADGDSRFVMLETIRRFARTRLGCHDEQRSVAIAHADWIIELVKPAEFATAYPGNDDLLNRLELEYANVLAALNWADRTGDDARLLEICVALAQFWIASGRVKEGRNWLERAIARSGNSDDLAQRRARAKIYLGRALSRFGEAEQADATMSEGLAELVTRDRPEVVNFALLHRGALANQLGEFDRAESLLEKARLVANTIEDPTIAATAEAAVLANLGVCAHGRGDLETARKRFELSLAGYRQHAFTFGVVRALRDLGDVERDRENYAGSVTNYQECLGLLGERFDLRVLIDVLEGIAVAAAAWKRPELSAHLLGAAESIREQYGGVFMLTSDQRAHDRSLAMIRLSLPENELTAAWHAGRQYRIQDAVAEALSITPTDQPRAAADQASIKLSRREVEVLNLIVAGNSDRAIADVLFLSVRTVEAHVARILRKFEVHSRSAAVSAAIATGIVQPTHGASVTSLNRSA